jgi:DNA/RNA endonuclease YhcR with UshA esterase domain
LVGAGGFAVKQSEDAEAFFKKYSFTSSRTMKCPTTGDTMQFEGLESRYVGELEMRIKDLEKYIQCQNQKIDFLMNREFHKWEKIKSPTAREESK